MKKILTTVAGLLAFALIGTACGPAVDTKEATSTTPASVVTFSAAELKASRVDLRHDPVSRSAARPVVKPKPKVVTKPKVVKPKVIKPRVHKVKKKIVKPKKVYKKTYKVKKKVTKKTRTHKVRVSGIAACIAKYESGGNPRAQNPSSSASGLYQFIDGTWNHYGGYSRAMYAPVSVQTSKFYQIWDGGRGAHNWVVAHKCGY